MLLQRVIEDAACDHVMYLDHIVGRGVELFAKVRAIGAEGPRSGSVACTALARQPTGSRRTAKN